MAEVTRQTEEQEYAERQIEAFLALGLSVLWTTIEALENWEIMAQHEAEQVATTLGYAKEARKREMKAANERYKAKKEPK